MAQGFLQKKLLNAAAHNVIMPKKHVVMHFLMKCVENLTPAQKQCDQFAHRQLEPRRAAVVALVGALGDFHLA